MLRHNVSYPKNNTLEFCINEFSKGQLMISAESFEYGRKINKNFYENEKEVGMIGVDLNMNFKIVTHTNIM
mgnify:CR=1 FL=1